MDALSPYSPYERVVVMSSSQIGKTEILNNFVGYIVDRVFFVNVERRIRSRWGFAPTS